MLLIEWLLVDGGSLCVGQYLRQRLHRKAFEYLLRPSIPLATLQNKISVVHAERWGARGSHVRTVTGGEEEMRSGHFCRDRYGVLSFYLNNVCLYLETQS